jgi:hypothetical protein
MTAEARAQQPRPQLVEAAQPEIGWTPADRIAPGEYPAYSRSAKVYRYPQFKRWVCAVQFDVLDETLTKRLARVTWFLSLGSRDKPHVGRMSQYWRAWITANGRPPARRDRLSPQVFVRRHARVIVGDTKKNFRQQRVNPLEAYSVIRSIVNWQTG